MQVSNQGSICMFTPDSETEKAWMKEVFEIEAWQWSGGSLAVDHRMSHDLIEVMQDEGLSVKVIV